MALRACVDAGTQEGVFTVAAVAFGYDRAVKANREWERLLKSRTFHMTDLNARRGDFEGLSNPEVDEIMVGVVRILKEYASFAVAISCDASLVADALPVVAQKHPDMEHLLAAMRSVYGSMCHFAMTALGISANKGGPGRQISYVFERGDEGQRGLRSYLEFLDDGVQHHRLLLNSYSFRQLTITPKDEIAGIFHSSDFLAWEWSRHVDRHRKGQAIRRSLAEVAGSSTTRENESGIYLGNGAKVYCRHFKSERIRALLGYFSESLEATSGDEVDAAFNRYREDYPGPGIEASLEALKRGY